MKTYNTIILIGNYLLAFIYVTMILNLTADVEIAYLIGFCSPAALVISTIVYLHKVRGYQPKRKYNKKSNE